MDFLRVRDGLYLSNDGGDNWQRITALTDVAAQVAIWDTDSELSQSNAVIITDVVFDPFNPNTLYAAALQKGMFRNDNGGVTWQTAAYGMDPNEPVLMLVPDPNRPGVIYAGSKWSGVFVSIDGAKTWRRISQGLTNKSVISLALSDDGSTLYAGTFNAGAWRLGGENDGPPFRRIAYASDIRWAARLCSLSRCLHQEEKHETTMAFSNNGHWTDRSRVVS